VELDAHLQCILATGQLGRHQEMLRHDRCRLELAGRVHDRYHRAFVGPRARELLGRGDPGQAIELAAEAVSVDPATAIVWASTVIQANRLRDLHDESIALFGSWMDEGHLSEDLAVVAPALMARAFADAGRFDAAGALLDELAGGACRRLSVPGTWTYPAELGLLADVCATLGSEATAVELIPRLEPWSGLHLQLSAVEYLGPASLGLGRLYRLIGDLDESARQLSVADAEARSMGSPVKAVEAMIELAITLMQQGGPSSRANAEELADDAARWAQARGLHFLVRRARLVAA
jgi:tetratricopeptide (TPR) repeat protein